MIGRFTAPPRRLVFSFKSALARLTACTLIALLLGAPLDGADAATLAQTFAPGKGSASVDHSAWDNLLKTYVKRDMDGLNRVAYARFKAKDRAALQRYLAMLQATDVAQLSRDEQFAFWVNLYNAKTVDVILAYYPVKSIREIDISPGLSGFFSKGPWGKKMLKVNGVELTLDDVEHEILRPIWKDPRIHYVVNCAAVGCPNLATTAYTGANKGALLEDAARDYINNPRGVSIAARALTVSKIYSWYKEDFGSSDASILKHLRRYANPPLAAQLNDFKAIAAYEYDWTLNNAE